MKENSKDAVGMEFPCRIGVKIFINNDQSIESLLREFVLTHLSEEHLSDWNSRESSGGKYLAVTAQVEAQSREHIDDFYKLLTDNEHVIMAI